MKLEPVYRSFLLISGFGLLAVAGLRMATGAESEIGGMFEGAGDGVIWNKRIYI